MRTAALPTFRKLYRRINHSASGFKDGLIHGNYELVVNYSKISIFESEKKSFTLYNDCSL